MIDDPGLVAALLVNGVISGAVLSLMAVGFAIVYAATGHFHVAQAAVFAVAGYGVFVAIDSGLGLLVALVVGLACGVVVGLGTNRFLYRPLEARGTSRLMVLIASLAVSIAADNALAIAFSAEPKFISAPSLKESLLSVGDVNVTVLQFAGFVVGIVGLVATGLYLSATRQGRGIRAAAENPSLAQALGLPLSKLKTRVFLAGSLLAATAGAYSAFEAGAAPGRGLGVFLIAAIAVIAGGVGSITGAAAAAFVIGIVQSLSLLVVSESWSTTIVFAMFIAWIVVRPEGLAPSGIRAS